MSQSDATGVVVFAEAAGDVQAQSRLIGPGFTRVTRRRRSSGRTRPATRPSLARRRLSVYYDGRLAHRSERCQGGDRRRCYDAGPHVVLDRATGSIVAGKCMTCW